MDTDKAYTAREVGALLGLTDERIRQLAAAGHVEKIGRGRYPLGPAICGYVEFLRRQMQNKPATETATNIAHERLRRLRIENDAAEGLSIPVEDVRLVLTEVATLLATRLDGIPSRVAAVIVGHSTAREVRVAVEDEIRAIRADMGSALARLATDPDDGGDPDAVAEKVA